VKRLFLILLSLAILILSACSNDNTLVNTNTSTSTTKSTTSVITKTPTAIFIVTNIEQTYYEVLGEWSEYATIHFKIQNTGETDISYYEVYFNVTCDNGHQYQGWTNGSHIWVNEEWSDSVIIDVNKEKVESAVVSNYELRPYTSGKRPEVVYEITGSAEKVDVTLSNSSGGTEQYDDVSLPARYTYTTFSNWFLYISAQNQGEYGTVRVTIYTDGELYKTSFSSGAYVIASASGTKP